MIRRISVLVAALLFALPASSAWARGDGWVPIGNQSGAVTCLDGTVLLFRFQSHEFMRTVDADGQSFFQVTGEASVTVKNRATGAVAGYNVSGPSPHVLPAL